MLTLRWTLDGAEFSGETPRAVVEAMRDASPFTAALSLEDYMRGVVLRAENLHPLATVRCDMPEHFLEDMVAAKLLEHVVTD